MAKTTYAHIPGGGPAGRTCGECAHFRKESWSPKGRPHQWCAKALELSRQGKAGNLSSSTPSCRYFEETRHG